MKVPKGEEITVNGITYKQGQELPENKGKKKIKLKELNKEVKNGLSKE